MPQHRFYVSKKDEGKYFFLSKQKRLEINKKLKELFRKLIKTFLKP